MADPVVVTFTLNGDPSYFAGDSFGHALAYPFLDFNVSLMFYPHTGAPYAVPPAGTLSGYASSVNARGGDYGYPSFVSPSSQSITFSCPLSYFTGRYATDGNGTYALLPDLRYGTDSEAGVGAIYNHPATVEVYTATGAPPPPPSPPPPSPPPPSAPPPPPSAPPPSGLFGTANAGQDKGIYHRARADHATGSPTAGRILYSRADAPAPYGGVFDLTDVPVATPPTGKTDTEPRIIILPDGTVRILFTRQ